MDELRPPSDDEEPPEGLLGDIVLCPAVTARQAAEHGRTAAEEAEYLLVHGLLHLLGYDHAEPDEKAEMFGLKDKIIAGLGRPRRSATAPSASLDDSQPTGSSSAIALVLAIFAGLTAAAEAALSSFSRPGPTGSSPRGIAGATKVRKIVDDPPRYLNTALFVRTVLEISASSCWSPLVVFGIFPETWQAGADHRRVHDRRLLHLLGRRAADHRPPARRTGSPARPPGRWSRSPPCSARSRGC